ncbi:hypothetical protein FHG64_14660 [Antarcticibacterium flavum]|uniref:Histone deacetylase n=1 Tax=Antarcticibacterium flavum TaxID=2058175 RepID=A0A5B7X5S7_9FLAO|nr:MULTISPECIES: hypothetical protein [Antarcticibacterium]MCM4161748.1 hypothetical protein [Antarcticibacterium sp. W02-3]QCY70540.1 hypothetical protein FHG64_14660 [Antarcticibacterium flavum]
MRNKVDKIWYASYGSNLLKKRFSCYIAGGTPAGAQREYAGCTDKSLPEANKPITINAELYFARKSKTWHGGGVAFIKPKFNSDAKTLGKMHLITSDQFAEVVKQEIRLEEDLVIDLETLEKRGSLLLNESSWYNQLLFLGREDGYPIFTFTNKDYLKEELNPPHETYLNTISAGLKETYGMKDVEIENYWKSKNGIKKDAEG